MVAYASEAALVRYKVRTHHPPSAAAARAVRCWWRWASLTCRSLQRRPRQAAPSPPPPPKKPPRQFRPGCAHQQLISMPVQLARAQSAGAG